MKFAIPAYVVGAVLFALWNGAMENTYRHRNPTVLATISTSAVWPLALPIAMWAAADCGSRWHCGQRIVHD